MSTGISSRGGFVQCAEQRAAGHIDELKRIYFQVADVRAIDGRMVLSGRVQKISQFDEASGGSPLLDQNLILAQITLDYVNERVMFSGNYPYRMRPDAPPISHTDLSKVTDFVQKESNEENIARSEKYGVGNCGEMAFIGLRCPCIGATNAECYYIENGNHALLVIGRDPNTDPNDPSTWNPETVICDPWANAYYPANRMTDFLADYCGRIRIKDNKGVDRIMTLVKPFDKKTQSLRQLL